MIDANMSIIITFAIYLLCMIGVGCIFYQKTEKLSDYILGGRKLNSWVTSLSAQASDMSGWLLIGLPGAAYATGIGAAWIAVGLAIGTYFNWKFVAKRLRKYTQIAGNAITLPDYFENRFRDNSKVLRVVSAIFILIFFLIYTASGFVAGARLFNTVFGVEYVWALATGAFVIILYTFLGGFKAVCWTDFFQGLLMLVAIVIVPLASMQSLGGVGVTFDKLRSIDPTLLNIFSAGGGEMLTAIGIISSLAWGLGYFGQPHILVRFMAIRSADQVKKARWIAMVWVTITLAAAVLVGIVGRVYLTEFVQQETVFMVMVSEIFPAVIAGVLLSAILAAVMSTADSQLLVTASAIAEDFYKPFFKKDATDGELVWVSRITVIIVAIIAFIFAINPESTVFGLVSYAWAGFGAAFGPTIILSLFWKRMTRNGALAGIISGGLTALIWMPLKGGLFDLYEIVPGFIVSLIAIVVFSRIGKAPTDEMITEFDSVNGEEE